jgi:hypothetical protein
MMYVNNLKALCIQHWERRTYILKKNFKRLNKCTKKKNNAPNCVERFKVPTVLMVMSCSVTFCWFALHETLILLLFCVFIEEIVYIHHVYKRLIHDLFHISPGIIPRRWPPYQHETQSRVYMGRGMIAGGIDGHVM